jgi:small-conductance mechanosensitive channel
LEIRVGGVFLDNKRANTTPITIFFSVLMFLILWFLWLGKWLKQSAIDAVQLHNLTGIEAFVLNNINVVVYVVLIIFILAALSWRTSQ